MNISWRDKTNQYVGLKNLPILYADCLEFWEHRRPGIVGVCTGFALSLMTSVCACTATLNEGQL